MKPLEIQHSRAAGLSVDRAAELSGVSSRTVERVNSEEKIEDPAEHDRRAGGRVGRPSKLAEHEGRVRSWLQAEPGLPGGAVLERLGQEGYEGDKSAVYELVRKHRPPKTPDGVVRFEAVPGEICQHDFGQHRVRYEDGTTELVRFFASRLEYSRMVRVL